MKVQFSPTIKAQRMRAMLALLAIAAGLGLWLALSGNADHVKFPTNPHVGAAVVTANLLAQTRDLKENLAHTQGRSPAALTHEYIAALQQVQRDCQQLSRYAAESVTGDMAVYLTKSARLCKELSPIAHDSQKLYEATAPLLKLQTKFHRYQTLPGIRVWVHDRHKKAVEVAYKATAEQVHRMSFSTQAANLTESLRVVITTSSGLSYGHEIAAYQTAMLAERQRYWTSYGDIDSLEAVLRIQLGRYCTALPSALTSGDAATVCKNT